MSVQASSRPASSCNSEVCLLWGSALFMGCQTPAVPKLTQPQMKHREGCGSTARERRLSAPAIRQPIRLALHHCHARAPVGHAGQQLLRLQRVRRRVWGRILALVGRQVERRAAVPAQRTQRPQPDCSEKRFPATSAVSASRSPSHAIARRSCQTEERGPAGNERAVSRTAHAAISCRWCRTCGKPPAMAMT